MKIQSRTNIAVIGAGASGLITAITAKQINPSLNITVFEKNDKLGRKILASGNGRCNITNTTFTSKNYYGKDPKFVNSCLERFNFEKTQKFFNDLGLILDIKDDGKVYPLSNEAKSVTKILEQKANDLGINFVFNYIVEDIKYENTKFIINNKIFDKLVISTGLQASPQLGSTNDGLKFAKFFNHNIIKPYPALVGLEIDAPICSRLFGVKLYSEVSLYINNQLKTVVKGDVLFTKYGVSGFAILDISTLASYQLSNNQNVQININLLPLYTRAQLLKLLANIQKNNSYKSIEDILVGLIPLKLINIVSSNSIKQTVNNLQNMRFEISSTHGFKHAEASGGGVDTSQINSQTMQSKNIDNLYFTGETLDIVGHRGGYNFAFAWASGYCAGLHISEEK